jgi:small-conductance mechanosensitive channel
VRHCLKDKAMREKLSLEHAVWTFAGFMLLPSEVLTRFVHPAFVWLTVFVGVNLFQQALRVSARRRSSCARFSG